MITDFDMFVLNKYLLKAFSLREEVGGAKSSSSKKGLTK
jgi:hypothetical protein